MLEWAPNPKWKILDIDTQGERQGNMETENGVKQLQARNTKSCLQKPGVKRLFPHSSQKENMPAADILTWASSLQDCESVNFCYLSPWSAVLG